MSGLKERSGLKIRIENTDSLYQTISSGFEGEIGKLNLPHPILGLRVTVVNRELTGLVTLDYKWSRSLYSSRTIKRHGLGYYDALQGARFVYLTMAKKDYKGAFKEADPQFWKFIQIRGENGTPFTLDGVSLLTDDGNEMLGEAVAISRGKIGSRRWYHGGVMWTEKTPIKDRSDFDHTIEDFSTLLTRTVNWTYATAKLNAPDAELVLRAPSVDLDFSK